MSPADHTPLQSSLDRIRGEVDRLIDAVKARGGKALDAVGLATAVRGEFPAIDLSETNDALHATANVAGIDPATLDVQITGGMLTLRGIVTSPVLGQGGTVHRAERHVGTFERSIMLPTVVDPENAVADLRQGLLHVRLPKVTSNVGRKVPVRTPESASAES